MAALGCGGSQHAEMPLKVGEAFTYEVVSGMAAKHVDTIRVVGAVPLAGVSGFELKGDLGVSTFAWRKGELLVGNGPYGHIEPPLPLLDLDVKPDKEGVRTHTWAGTITTVGKPMVAEATVRTDPDKIQFGSHAVTTLHSTVVITMEKRTITLESWFLPGTGMIKQQQRTGTQLNYAATLLAQ